jgi:hypothetical protein
MKTRLFTGLALAAALLIGGPAYASDNHKKAAKPAGHTHAVAAVHHSGSHAVAAVHRGGAAKVASGRTVTPSKNIASRRTVARSTNLASGRAVARSTNLASGRTFNAPATQGYARNVSRSTPSVAFGGSANGSHGRYAFASHQGWSQDRDYSWDGHHYRWYNNGWFIIDPYPYYGYGGGSVGAEVQSALSQQGYYQGPVDGVVGPGTQAAIAAYQRDNGLRVTGTITPDLLNNLGVG